DLLHLVEMACATRIAQPHHFAFGMRAEDDAAIAIERHETRAGQSAGRLFHREADWYLERRLPTGLLHRVIRRRLRNSRGRTYHAQQETTDAHGCPTHGSRYSVNVSGYARQTCSTCAGRSMVVAASRNT